MIDYIKEPHTSIFIGQTWCEKTHLVLELTEKKFNKNFDYIVIICPTLRENKTHHAKGWIKNDDKVWLVDPKDNINGLKSCQNCYDPLKYYLTSMISSLIKTLIRGGSPY